LYGKFKTGRGDIKTGWIRGVILTGRGRNTYDFDGGGKGTTKLTET